MVVKCKFCATSHLNGDTIDEAPELYPKLLTSQKTGKPFCLWACPNDCKDSSDKFNQHGFVTDADVLAAIEKGPAVYGGLPEEARQCVKSVGVRTPKPVSTVNALQPVSAQVAPLLGGKRKAVGPPLSVFSLGDNEKFFGVFETIVEK
jgi:hypothetical protein